MATYGGFAPGSYNAWALNLITDVFCSPGVARGMQVTAPGGMAVSLGVDATANDGVVVLPNGGFVRIDQAITYTVPSNGGSGTRIDALVAFLDPTGVANPEFSLTYNSNWSGGFTGNTGNQWVIALISVAVGAVSIALSNITMNPNTARYGNPLTVLAGDGVGFSVQDSSSVVYLTPTSGLGGSPLPLGSYRNTALVAQDTAGGSHTFLFDTAGNLTVPNFVSTNRLYTTSYVGFGPPLVGGTLFGVLTTNGSYPSILLTPPTVNATAVGAVIQAWNLTQALNIFSIGGQFGAAKAWVDMNGHLWDATVGGNPVTTSGNTVGVRIFTGTTQPTNATNGDIWINA